MNKIETLPTIAAELLDGQQLIARLSNPDDPEDWETQRIRQYRAWSHLEVGLNPEAADISDAEHHFTLAEETATPQGASATDTIHLTAAGIMLRAYMPIFRDRRFKGLDNISKDAMHDSMLRLGNGMKFIREIFEEMPDRTFERAHYIGRFATHAVNLFGVTSGLHEARHLLMPASIREETSFPGKIQYSNHDAYTFPGNPMQKRMFRFKSVYSPGRASGSGTRIDPEALGSCSRVTLNVPQPTEVLNRIGEIVERKVTGEKINQTEREVFVSYLTRSSDTITNK